MHAAVGAYHDLLSDDELAAASAAELDAGQHRRRLFFGDHPLSVSLRPGLVTRANWDRAVQAAQAIHGALGTLEAALLASSELRAELDLSRDEERLVVSEPGCRSSPSSRLDSFFEDEVRYVEFNAESPAGMAYGDVLGEVMDDLPVMRRFRERWPLTPLRSRLSQLDCMLAAFADWGGTGSPSVAIVDWPGLPTLNEFDMFRDFFAAHGISCVICEPASLEYDGSRLRAADGTVVNLVYRRVLTSELLARGTEAMALCQAYVDGAIVMVNTFRAKLLHKKMSLALLSDDRYESLYSGSERQAIARHIPWTRRLRQGKTTRDNRDVPDLVQHVLDHRDKLVLKPNDEYGGKGVVLGWTVDATDWEKAVGEALHQSYVVQEAVPVPREPFPIAMGGSIEVLDMAIDMDPYIFETPLGGGGSTGGDAGNSTAVSSVGSRPAATARPVRYEGVVGGVLTRLSSSALLNVTAGAGSVVPTYVLEEE
jgi:hypothetical protein